jgi:hypothetical protein
MYQVKQLYVLWETGEGGKKLIPKESYNKFLEDLDNLESELGMPLGAWDDRDKDEVQQDIYDLIDEQVSLEGELVYVVLPQDVKE